MLETHRVYRNIDLNDRFFGFEFTDLILLALVYSLATFLNKDGIVINITVTVFAALFLKIFKLGKPKGFLNDYFTFHFRKRTWSNTI